MLAALAAYILWASPDRPLNSRIYEIRFERSVAGLFRNSAITFQGVAVGRVERIRFAEADPEVIRVRVLITDPEAPMLQGTTAELNRDLFGVATISLDGAPAGSPPLEAARENEVPIIPVKKGGIFLEDPVSMIESVATTLDKMNRALDPAGQKTISDTIAALEAKSADLALRAPKLANTFANARGAMVKGVQAAGAISATATQVQAQLVQSKTKVAEMHQTLANARAGLKAIDERVAETRPKLREFNAADMTAQVRELRSATDEFKETVKKVETEGVSSMLSKPQLPEYSGK
jgi:phospholipid/cholesterol/gamma-HCH transport system substrate-binding protein